MHIVVEHEIKTKNNNQIKIMLYDAASCEKAVSADELKILSFISYVTVTQLTNSYHHFSSSSCSDEEELVH